MKQRIWHHNKQKSSTSLYVFTGINSRAGNAI